MMKSYSLVATANTMDLWHKATQLQNNNNAATANSR